MIAVGQLDTPIEIQTPVTTANANYGGIMDTVYVGGGLHTPTKVWAHLIWKGGKESEEGDQQAGESKVEFYIRYETYKDAIQPTWRIKHQLAASNYNYYYIEKIDHIDGRHKMTKLTAIQKDNN